MKSNTKEKTKAIGTSVVGAKGQIVIPASIREMFSIEPGDTIVLLADKKKGIAIVKSDVLSKIAERGMDDGDR